MRILIATLSIGLAAATPPSRTRVIVDPPGPYAFNASAAAHFCVTRVLDYRVRMSAKAAKSELEWCYRTQLPRA